MHSPAKHVAAFGGAFILAIASFLMTILITAAPANAEISFCSTSKNSPCIGPVNGCTLKFGDGRYGFAPNGETIVADNGARYTCFNGRWVKSATLGAPEVQLGFMVGVGLLTQGPPAPPCDPNQTFCP